MHLNVLRKRGKAPNGFSLSRIVTTERLRNEIHQQWSRSMSFRLNLQLMYPRIYLMHLQDSNIHYTYSCEKVITMKSAIIVYVLYYLFLLAFLT